ncbi:MAG: response regulator transcription factor [Gammaproteobacteria bacterium]
MRLLIVEDDRELATELAAQLERGGHEVAATAASLSTARTACTRACPDILILDRMLPDGDGLEFIPWFRTHCPDAHVLVLSALAELEARVGGLNAGADDYLGKPYAEAELLARIAALARRREPFGTELHCGPLLLDRLSRTACLGENALRLNPREYSLLEYFMLHAGETLTRTMILRNVWGYDFDPGTNVIGVHVSRLRAKLDEYGGADMLVTERGVGYRLIAGSER